MLTDRLVLTKGANITQSPTEQERVAPTKRNDFASLCLSVKYCYTEIHGEKKERHGERSPLRNFVLLPLRHHII